MWGWVVLAFGLLAIPATAQTFYDKAGNPRGHLQHQGDRTYFRDNAGNPHGYSVQRGDKIEYRDNAGNLVGTEKVR
jgi:hypothetical protein